MTAQYPIDGKPGKDWKVTSYMGWRMHPVHKVKKHHNGTDIISKHKNVPIEAPYAGKVIKTGNNPSGFGNYVILKHKIKGVKYVTLYGHMVNGSVKVKTGQNIQAGTVLGKMGTTGTSTGVHLHWELQKGSKWVWSDKGKGFIEPVKFFEALIAWEKSIATAPVEAKETDPVAPAPTHDDTGAKAASSGATVATPAVTTPVTPAQPAVRPTLKKGSKHHDDVKYLQKKLGVATGGADGIFGPKTHAAVVAFQKKHGITANGIVGPDTWKALG